MKNPGIKKGWSSNQYVDTKLNMLLYTNLEVEVSTDRFDWNRSIDLSFNSIYFTPIGTNRKFGSRTSDKP